MEYDHVVIGGGIAGLYFSHKSPGKTIVLEKSPRVGGRTVNINFHDVSIPLGAGIGLVGKDDLLFQLLLELNISYHTGMLNLTSEECLPIVQKLYNQMSTIQSKMSFREYMATVLTPIEHTIFRRANGFTDMYDADALTTMLYYSLDENCTKYMVFSLNWSEVVKELQHRVNIHTKCKALRITGKYPKFKVYTDTHGIIHTKNVIIATTISGIRELISDPIYDRVHAHPFMRVYGTFSGKALEILKNKYEHIQVVGGRLHYITHMNENVFMIAYTDGSDAVSLHQDLKKDPYTILEKEVGFRPDDYFYSFWEEGVHYYTPGDPVDFRKLRNPEKGIYVIGEAVAMSQGWVGGALETVDDILPI